MNDHQMQILANDNLAIRRAEADRTRLAHTGDTGTASKRTATRRTRRHAVVSLGTLLQRVVLF